LNGSAILTCTILLAFLLSPLDTLAQDAEVGAVQETTKKMRDVTPEERRAIIEAMSDEEREAFRQKTRAAMKKRRAEWKAMTPEERQAKRTEAQERLDAMSPEEREAMRERREAAKQRQQKQKNKGPAEAQQEPPT